MRTARQYILAHRFLSFFLWKSAQLLSHRVRLPPLATSRCGRIQPELMLIGELAVQLVQAVSGLVQTAESLNFYQSSHQNSHSIQAAALGSANALERAQDVRRMPNAYGALRSARRLSPLAEPILPSSSTSERISFCWQPTAMCLQKTVYLQKCCVEARRSQGTHCWPAVCSSCVACSLGYEVCYEVGCAVCWQVNGTMAHR